MVTTTREKKGRGFEWISSDDDIILDFVTERPGDDFVIRQADVDKLKNKLKANGFERTTSAIIHRIIKIGERLSVKFASTGCQRDKNPHPIKKAPELNIDKVMAKVKRVVSCGMREGVKALRERDRLIRQLRGTIKELEAENIKYRKELRELAGVRTAVEQFQKRK